MPGASIPSPVTSLPLVYQGKVRDIHEIDNQHWLLVATDRVSAFDVILPNQVPDKGRLLTQLAMFWFGRFESTIANHLADIPLHAILEDPEERRYAEGRSMVVKRLEPLPIEAVVRGYIAGSGWKDYQASGAVCGHALPKGLRIADALPEPLFTPATKAAVGDHDENIDFEVMTQLVGGELATRVRKVSLSIYHDAAEFATKRGILLADTKFEFGLNASGDLTLMDEILTPDSSRYWDSASWSPGSSPASFDKQFIRDWLETQDWNKTAPGPTLPEHIIDGTLQRYREAVRRLTETPS